ncbi:MAG: acyl carrier protein [Actinocatenispora sp.]
MVPDPVTACGPDNGLHGQVRTAWESALGRTDFTDEDDFFLLGGHSLRATRMMKTLSRQIGVRLPVRLVMDNRNVRALVAAVNARVQAESSEGSTP